ncbi:VOC family protein [Actinosynnema sp. NPDC023587]|uniref:VOC family protein n=1 Tax=Actinosynnema sp. NPDC023587 TaxID=3154695 RepID=UPI0033E477E4
MGSDITGLHHVGHVVRDLAEALALYRRLGFVVPPPAYPAMAPCEGAAPEPFGAANTHADFARDFVELATPVDPGARLPDDATLVPLHAPPDVLPVLLERIAATSANLATCLDRFEGLHILMFSSSDVDGTAARLTAAGVRHGGVNAVRRPVRPDLVETVRYLEVDGERAGVVAEGRIGVVADLDPEIQATRVPAHPNGAVALLEAVLCVPVADLAEVEARYRRYLDVDPVDEGVTRVFAVGSARLTLVADRDLGALLPGERAVAVPALVAFTVGVTDRAVTARYFHEHGLPFEIADSGDMFVPARSALGAAVIFRHMA